MRKTLLLAVILLFTTSAFAQENRLAKTDTLLNNLFVKMKNNEELTNSLYNTYNATINNITFEYYRIVESDPTHAVVEIDDGSGNYCTRLHFKLKEKDGEAKIIGKFQSNTLINPWWNKENLCD
jgi:hypothetical protein